MSADALLQLRAVSCDRAPASVRELTVSIGQGGFHLLAGESDAGHELALRLLGLLDTPDAGKVFVADTPASELPEDSRAQFRDRHLGFVFTAPFLLP
ncbi:MAG TPA: hypothetical protein VF593_09070, partial [Chthoniobacteraceae bacterium]